MKRIISIIVLTAMFTAIAVGLAGCGVKTTLRSGNDPIIGKWKCNEAYDEYFDWLGRVYYGLDIDASGWGIIKQSGDVIGEGSVIYRNFTDGKYDGYSMGEMMVLYDSLKDQVIISVSDYVLIFERIS